VNDKGRDELVIRVITNNSGEKNVKQNNIIRTVTKVKTSTGILQ